MTKKYNPIKFYSGDILFPSYLSTFHKLLNSIKFHAGIYGLNDVRSNSLNLLEDSVDKTNSIWLMSNLFHVKKQYLAITKCSIMMIIENKNVKIGIIGLMHTNDLNQSQIKYVDYCYFQYIKYGNWDSTSIKQLNDLNAVSTWENFLKSADINVKKAVK